MPRNNLPPNAYLRADGRIYIRVVVGTPPNTRRIGRYARTVEQAWEVYHQLQLDHARGNLNQPESITLREWLNQWVDSKRELTPASIHEYRRLIRHICTALGDRPIQRLKPADIQSILDGLQGYAHRSRRLALMVLRSAFEQAMGLEVISRDPTVGIRLARKPQTNIGQAWEPDEILRFTQTTHTRRLWPMYALMLSMGVRIGEVRALRLHDLSRDSTGLYRLSIERTIGDEQFGERTIRENPKTIHGRRTLWLPPTIGIILDSWLVRLEHERGTKGWKEEGLLFPSSVGTILSYYNVRRDFRAAIQATGEQNNEGEWTIEPIPTLRIHDLRHTAAVLMRMAGVSQEVRSRLLGHANKGIAEHYSNHFFHHELVDAAALIEARIAPLLTPTPDESGVSKGVQKKMQTA